jgi:hypothetical protein
MRSNWAEAGGRRRRCHVGVECSAAVGAVNSAMPECRGDADMVRYIAVHVIVSGRTLTAGVDLRMAFGPGRSRQPSSRHAAGSPPLARCRAST